MTQQTIVRPAEQERRVSKDAELTHRLCRQCYWSPVVGQPVVALCGDVDRFDYFVSGDDHPADCVVCVDIDNSGLPFVSCDHGG